MAATMRLCKRVANTTIITMNSKNITNSTCTATSKQSNFSITFTKLGVPEDHAFTHFSCSMGSHCRVQCRYPTMKGCVGSTSDQKKIAKTLWQFDMQMTVSNPPAFRVIYVIKYPGGFSHFP